MRAILAAREPLPVEILQRLFNWQDEELRDFTRPLASLFPVTSESGYEVIKPYHKSLADWLANDASAGTFYVSSVEGHRLLGGLCWQEYAWDKGARYPYVFRHLISHLTQCESWNELRIVFGDADFLQACIEGRRFHVLADEWKCAVRKLGQELDEDSMWPMLAVLFERGKTGIRFANYDDGMRWMLQAFELSVEAAETNSLANSLLLRLFEYSREPFRLQDFLRSGASKEGSYGLRYSLVPVCVEGLRRLKDGGVALDQFFEQWLNELENDEAYP